MIYCSGFQNLADDPQGHHIFRSCRNREKFICIGGRQGHVGTNMDETPLCTVFRAVHGFEFADIFNR